MIQVAFWALVGIIFYVYFGYPILLVFSSKLKSIKQRGEIEFTPQITLIIAAHNEEKVIKEKIENSLSLDYPKDKLEIIVASDGSTDATNEIVKGFASRDVIAGCIES